MATSDEDWDPGAYDAFRGLRLRPAQDLLAAVGDVPAGAVVDLGCGSGAAGPLLRRAFRARRLLGVDASPAMLAEAEAGGAYDETIRADIAIWTAAEAPARLFSNAVLHWLSDHATLLPRIAKSLVPEGWLAVQMPGQNTAPSHAAYRRLTGRNEDGPGIAAPEAYEAWLSPLGAVHVWETLYFQHLPPCAHCHPVRAFTAATYGRPFLDGMESAERAGFEAAYDREMGAAYPLRADGSVLFPFRRVFVLFQRSGAATG